MDFFAAQDRAKARTRWLILYFILGVAGLVVSLNVLAIIGVSVHRARHPYSGRHYFDNSSAGADASGVVWDPEVSVVVTLVTLGIVGGSCLYKVSELRAGGGAVALSVGATRLAAQPAAFSDRQLRNIVEEMALASGVPVPEIYVMEEEDAINAFAAGLRPEEASIVVTRGALKYLSRDELQGVIGHEFSHILNGDMRLNVQLIGAVFGLLVIAIIGKVILQMVTRTRWRGRNGGGAAAGIMVLGGTLFVLGYLGVFFGRLIQASVSRQREGLADASAVQFTRNPGGLAGALKKIGGLGVGSAITHAHAEETAHMFFAPAVDSLFATHPPLEARIRELEPNWDGKFISPRPPGLAPDLQKYDAGAPPRATATTVQQMLAPAGAVAALSLAEVQDWRASLPAAITTALADAQGCRALVLALALVDDRPGRDAQIARLQEQSEPAAATAAQLAQVVADIPAGRQLPLLELALAGIARLTPPEKNFLLARLRDLTGFDRGNQNLHQFALWRVAEYRLNPRPPRLGPSQPEFYRNELSVVLSALAHLSTPDDAAARPVFAQGLNAIMGMASLALTPRVGAGIEQVQAACARLESAPFGLKKQLLEAGAIIVQADGIIEPAESELLRALAASLGCAVPLV